MEDNIEYLKPFGDRVLLELPDQKEINTGEFIKKVEKDQKELDNLNKTKSGLVLIGAEPEEKFKNCGKVIAVSDSLKDLVRVGQEYIYAHGQPLKFKGKRYILVKQTDLLYLVERP